MSSITPHHASTTLHHGLKKFFSIFENRRKATVFITVHHAPSRRICDSSEATFCRQESRSEHESITGRLRFITGCARFLERNRILTRKRPQPVMEDSRPVMKRSRSVMKSKPRRQIFVGHEFLPRTVFLQEQLSSNNLAVHRHDAQRAARRAHRDPTQNASPRLSLNIAA